MPSQDVVNFIRQEVYEGKELSEIGGLLCNKSLAKGAYAQYSDGVGADNMTIIIMAILHGLTPEEWYGRIHRLEEVTRED
jgi:protein phosphatase PTC2/3